jgi:hypothetical protein
MQNPVESRQLAAIVFTDIVGYTRMMDADEVQTTRILNVILELPTPVTLNWLKVFPEYDNIRSSPEFQTLIGGNPI